MRLRTALVVVASMAVLAGGLVGFNLAPRKPVLQSVQVAGGTPTASALEGDWPEATTTTTKPRHPTSFLVADAVVAEVPLYSEPDVPLDGGRVMQNPTWEGLDVVFLVKERQGEWLDVQVSSRPNGMRAWVHIDDVKLRTVPNWIRVELGAKRASVLHGDTVLHTAPVATGRPSAPTPLGVFFVDGIVHLTDTTGPYGVAQMSVSGFSDVYSSFGGGVGQIALHGTNAPGLMGQSVSAGCVRLTNDDISVFIMYAPTGTPVEVVP